ncbi:structural maintenance of chromosome 2 [Naegleria gruberi]|uniref:Structural maintenance of chromosome 2 n=1 Tax=Naegleria gruberi TaxID=5762 RepID=D2VRG7_NAEGR|nr:structural maintenance of chromosome 2 [Naegleria gruberi]EFC40670.1 structural maintenance of chromosome 2 [Naegleria gruberi]|eukprot:XP_002673414.1 structural maintenance of chromosome 2 [Naegleria gruberi strain NEG-M]
MQGDDEGFPLKHELSVTLFKEKGIRKYTLDGKHVTIRAVQNFLFQHGLRHSSNFVIFQNHVVSLMFKNSKEIAEMITDGSGGLSFEQQAEKTLNEIQSWKQTEEHMNEQIVKLERLIEEDKNKLAVVSERKKCEHDITEARLALSLKRRSELEDHLAKDLYMMEELTFKKTDYEKRKQQVESEIACLELEKLKSEMTTTKTVDIVPMQKQISELSENLEFIKEEVDQLNNNYRSLLNEKSKVEERKKRQELERENLGDELRVINSKIATINGLLNNKMKEEVERDERYLNSLEISQDLKTVLVNMISLESNSQQYVLPLSVIMGKNFSTHIVETTSQSEKLLQTASQRKRSITIWPLDRLDSSQQKKRIAYQRQIRDKRGLNFVIPKDILNFDEKIEPSIDRCIGDFVISLSEDMSKQLVDLGISSVSGLEQQESFERLRIELRDMESKRNEIELDLSRNVDNSFPEELIKQMNDKIIEKENVAKSKIKHLDGMKIELVRKKEYYLSLKAKKTEQEKKKSIKKQQKVVNQMGESNLMVDENENSKFIDKSIEDLEVIVESLEKKAKTLAKKSKAMMVDVIDLEKKQTILENSKSRVMWISKSCQVLMDGISCGQKVVEKYNEVAFEKVQQLFQKFTELMLPNKIASLKKVGEKVSEGVEIIVKSKNSNKEGDTSQLSLISGGEKTMVSLAFLFSIATFKKSMFYILDECDANLDEEKQKLVSRILSRMFKNQQVILISHNSAVQNEADCIIHV